MSSSRRRTPLTFTEREIDQLVLALGRATAGEPESDDEDPALMDRLRERLLAERAAGPDTRGGRLSAREQAMLAALKTALREIEHELSAAGDEEVLQNPMLTGKQALVDETWRRVRAWEGRS